MKQVIDTIFKCDLEKLKILLPDKRQANLVVPGTEGCTPLHIAVGIENSNGRDKIVSYLLEVGADPNARSFEDSTPVHIAAMWNNCEELEKLIMHGGNPWLIDNENKNAFDLAINNKAYEAFQLLNIYLSQEKLNFKPTPKSNERRVDFDATEKRYFSTASNIEQSNFAFNTANENFPFFFSSDDETGSICSNNSYLLERAFIKSSSENIASRLISHHSQNTSVSDQSSLNFSIDSNKVTKRKFQNRSIFHMSAESRYLDTDEETNIALFEVAAPNDSFAQGTFYSTSSSSWKFFQTSDVSCSSVSSTNTVTDRSSFVHIPENYKNFSNSQIFLELKKLGDDPGPVLDCTRLVYLQRLIRLKEGGVDKVKSSLPKPKYCDEVFLFLEGKLNDDCIYDLMNNMAKEFNENSPKKVWREGNQRCCFNYFLLDPRVTQNLPQRAQSLSFNKLFLTFLDALFYVGKGTRGRPYSHLLEAVKAVSNDHLMNDKISHILDIWNSGMGVISLHCFNSSIPVEAYTQEACIIEAVGLENLTNIKVGNCYGNSTKWRRSLKREMGVALLNKALQIYLLEGEKQILPKDIRRGK